MWLCHHSACNTVFGYSSVRLNFVFKSPSTSPTAQWHARLSQRPNSASQRTAPEHTVRSSKCPQQMDCRTSMMRTLTTPTLKQSLWLSVTHPCFLDDVLFRYKVELEEGFDNILVVDGIPVIDNSKLEKLLAKISKEFGKKGSKISPDDIFVPFDEKSGKSKGYAWMFSFEEIGVDVSIL